MAVDVRSAQSMPWEWTGSFTLQKVHFERDITSFSGVWEGQRNNLKFVFCVNFFSEIFWDKVNCLSRHFLLLHRDCHRKHFSSLIQWADSLTSFHQILDLRDWQRCWHFLQCISCLRKHRKLFSLYSPNSPSSPHKIASVRTSGASYQNLWVCQSGPVARICATV